MINIKLNLGQIALAISAIAKPEKQAEIYKQGLIKLCYHASASKIFGPKQHPRDEKFSDNLLKDAKAALNLVLGEYFSDVKIEGSEKPASKPKITVESVLADLGLSLDEAKAFAAAKAAKLAEVEQEDEAEEISM